MRSWLIIFTLISACFSSGIWAAPKAQLWSYWQTNNATSQQTIDHQAWQQLLTRYVTVTPHQTYFNYRLVTQQSRQQLQQYIQGLTAIDPRKLNRNEQFAYWVNLYNAATVNLILQNYPIASITKLGGLFSFGPWDEKLLTINGKSLTLNDIEHRILRPIWQDKRIHYVVNCASLGCPDLMPTALTASNSQTLLDQAATRFINSTKGVDVINANNNQIQLSSIYDWYSSDFGSQSELNAHINHYRKQPVSLDKVRFDYNWQLNELKR